MTGVQTCALPIYRDEAQCGDGRGDVSRQYAQHHEHQRGQAHQSRYEQRQPLSHESHGNTVPLLILGDPPQWQHRLTELAGEALHVLVDGHRHAVAEQPVRRRVLAYGLRRLLEVFVAFLLDRKSVV